MKRQRGRGRKSGSPSNRSYESNGPDVKVRGTPSHIYEKYMQLARDASSAGDRIMAENYYQHAEHYLRIMQANMPKRDESENAAEDSEAADTGETGSRKDGGRSEAQGESAADGEDANNRNRRGRRRRRDADGEDDPLQVVTPEAEGAASDASADEAEKSEEDKPRKRTRTRRPKADADAQKALDAVDGGSAAADSDGNAGEAA